MITPECISSYYQHYTKNDKDKMIIIFSVVLVIAIYIYTHVFFFTGNYILVKEQNVIFVICHSYAWLYTRQKSAKVNISIFIQAMN